METLIDLVWDSAQKYGERPALIERPGLREDRWSYKRLHNGMNSVAYYLRYVRGLHAGDRLLLLGKNSPKLVAGFLGSMAARVVSIPLDPSSTQEFIRRVALETQATAILTDDSVQTITDLQYIHVDQIPFHRQRPVPEGAPKGADIAEIVFTSGTTGNPKGVVLTHNNIVSNIHSAFHIVETDQYWHFLSLLPLSHMLEQTVGLFLPLHIGSTIYYPAGRQSLTIMRAIKRYRITAIICVPQILTHLLHGIEREIQKDGHWNRWIISQRLAQYVPMTIRRVLFRPLYKQFGYSLKYFICGGAYLPPEVSRTWERMGINVSQGYGTTECSPTVAANQLGRAVHGSVGRALPGVDIRISEKGEIQVKGSNVTTGYWNNQKATEQAFTEDGWYCTGDLGWQDAEGYLYIKGRLKDMIVLSSGMNVFPEDIESVLTCQEGIKGSVVLGIEDVPGNVRVTAAILLEKEGIGQTEREHLAEAAVKKVNSSLAPHQQISQFRVWTDDDFPRTALGKIKRHAVKERIEQQEVMHSASPIPVLSQDVLLKRFQKVLSEITNQNPETISRESDLNFDLGLTSLSRVELAEILEHEFGVLVDESELACLEKVSQLIELFHSEKQPTQPFSYSEWPLHRLARITRAFLQQGLVFQLHRLVAHPFVVKGLEGLANLKLPALFVANHSSHVDTVSIIRALPSPIRNKLSVAAATDYFYRTRWLSITTSLLLNTFPFSREKNVRSSFEHCGELVDEDWSILIYPEGTRSPTGKLLPFKEGIGFLAGELGIPIVPIGVTGGHKIFPKGNIFPKQGPVTVTIGHPILSVKEMGVKQRVSFLQEAVADLL